MTTIHEITGTIPISLTAKSDWYLPATLELQGLQAYLGDSTEPEPEPAYAWSSTELSATDAFAVDMNNGNSVPILKSEVSLTYAIRSFVSSDPYEVGDIGEGGGIIFHIEAPTHYEYYTKGLSGAKYSNISTSCNADGFNWGDGVGNTATIIAQVGHTGSAAKLCSDLIY